MVTAQTFCVSERFQPEGQDWVYLKLKDREAWVPCNNDQEDFCEKLPPAVDEVSGSSCVLHRNASIIVPACLSVAGWNPASRPSQEFFLSFLSLLVPIGFF